MIQDSGEAKIANFELATLGVDEQVLRLDVPVDDVVAVAVLDGLEDLVEVVANILLLETVRVLFENLQQVLFDIFEYHV